MNQAMKRATKRIARLFGFLGVCLCFLVFVAAARLFLLGLSRAARMRIVAGLIRLWARTCLKVLALKISVHGLSQDLHSNPLLLVSNHQSYLDVVIIASVFPALFVAKAEVGRWPLIGRLAKLGGTIFVNREDAHSGVSCAYRVSRALRDGAGVQVFPESTTSDGSTVLPFHGLFFASAVRSRSPVLPLTIRFQSVNGRPMDREALDTVCWYGEADFALHFWNLLNIESAEVALIIDEPIKPAPEQRAEALAREARERISKRFANAVAVAAARAQAPIDLVESVEFAGAEPCSRPKG
ncbi:MAG TPA: lysophospholipid acyltransferase family protein [Blastocatellia bacterium]|jgi:1-acyl-sn-glycerol-3-phosphate acyltransferase|nr:lysophospholipid acyltransferase family protein [Blastocatellia bacterium]